MTLKIKFDIYCHKFHRKMPCILKDISFLTFVDFLHYLKAYTNFRKVASMCYNVAASQHGAGLLVGGRTQNE